MPLPNYSLQSIRVARLAGLRAERAGAKYVLPEHLLAAMLSAEGVLSRILEFMKIDARPLRDEVRTLAFGNVAGHSSGAAVKRTKPRLSDGIESILIRSEAEARSLGEREIHPHHLLLAMAKQKSPAAALLAAHQLSHATLRQGIRGCMGLRSPSRCPHCGYDLRATPLRCPECGRDV